MSEKYPRTPHLLFSLGAARDDRILTTLRHFVGQETVITEKMDGSNVCLEAENVYARSHNGAPTHPSFDALKSLHAALRFGIAPETQVFGEWLWARHSIAYDRLPDYLLVFGVRDTARKVWLSWEDTTARSQSLGLQTVPILWTGVLATEAQIEKTVLRLMDSPCCGAEQEGIVLRVTREFADADFDNRVAKSVRASHVQTTQHWSNQEIVRNHLA